MIFPLTAELYLGPTLGWVDVTADVRQAVADSGGGITVTRVHGDPGTADLVIASPGGRYSPRNPRSPYYGLLGRNTPVRLGLTLFADDFSRTVAAGWGTAAAGGAWVTIGAGGTVLTTDATVSAGIARHWVPAANAYRTNYYTGLALVDAEVRFTMDTFIGNVAGAGIEPGNVVMRVQPGDIGTYYLLRIEVSASEVVTVSLHHSTAGVIAGPVTVTGLVFAGQPLEVRASAVGPRLALKVWDAAAGGEPAGWHVTGVDTRITGAGYVGIRSGVAFANTNTKPVEFRYDDLVVLDRRACMEVSSWPTRWNLAGTDVWVPIQAAGILRRLAQGAKPLRSALYRYLTRTTPTAYWPLEDPPGSLQARSDVDRVAPMTTFGFSRFTAPGTGVPIPAANLPVFGSGSLCPGSAPTVDLAQGGVLQGAVPAGATAGWRIEWVMRAPRDKPATVVPIRWATDGTWDTWDIQIEATGLFATFGTGLSTAGSATATFNVFDGQPHHYQVEAFDIAGTVDARIYIDDVQVAQYTAFVPPMTGTCGSVNRVVVNPLEIRQDEARSASMPTLGHVAVWNPPAGLTTTVAAMRGHAAEPAADRIARLCAEEGVPVAVVRGPDTSAPMGPQLVAEFLVLLRECETADGGLLGETREQIALSYRALSALYNQAALSLDYAAIAEPFHPTDDDRAVRNDVTVSRPDGGTAQAVQTTGPLSVLPPPAGVGTYDTDLTVNVADDAQLPHQARWRVHLGTWDEARYPAARVNLAAPAWTANPALTARASAVADGDVVAVTSLPDWLPPGPASLMVRGSVEYLDQHERTIDWTASPAGPFTIATAAGAPRVPADGSTLAAPMTASAMTLSLASTAANGVWTTNPTEFPLLIRVGAEQMTLSGITGASSPQTATIIARGANGIQRAWPAGTEVDVWLPAIVPL